VQDGMCENCDLPDGHRGTSLPDGPAADLPELTRIGTGDFRLINPLVTPKVATDLGPKSIKPRPLDPRPHPDFEAPDPRKHQNPLTSRTHEFGPKKLRAKRANDLCKMLVKLPAHFGAPRGPPGGGLLTSGLLLTGGPSNAALLNSASALNRNFRGLPRALGGASYM
jgi:hypothetical protein